MTDLHVKSNLLETPFLNRYTVQSLYNTCHYNTYLDIPFMLWLQILFTMEFDKIILGK